MSWFTAFYYKYRSAPANANLNLYRLNVTPDRSQNRLILLKEGLRFHDVLALSGLYWS